MYSPIDVYNVRRFVEFKFRSFRMKIIEDVYSNISVQKRIKLLIDLL